MIINFLMCTGDENIQEIMISWSASEVSSGRLSSRRTKGLNMPILELRKNYIITITYICTVLCET